MRHDVAFREVVRLLGSKDQISYLVFDEAHCISQWVHGFRPDYLSFSEESTSIVPKATVILLSASATPDVISDVKQAIGLDDVTVVSDQFDRPNLKFEVHEKSKESAKEIISILCSGESGLVYCSTKPEFEESRALLEAEGILSQAYHAKQNCERILAATMVLRNYQDIMLHISIRNCNKQAKRSCSLVSLTSGIFGGTLPRLGKSRP